MLLQILGGMFLAQQIKIGKTTDAKGNSQDMSLFDGVGTIIAFALVLFIIGAIVEGLYSLYLWIVANIGAVCLVTGIIGAIAWVSMLIHSVNKYTDTLHD